MDFDNLDLDINNYNYNELKNVFDNYDISRIENKICSKIT